VTLPTHPVRHAAAFGLTAHVTLPLRCVTQHVTAPGRPHVDLRARRFTAAAHARLSEPTRAATTPFAQRT
jgi:hypothetical protein